METMEIVVPSDVRTALAESAKVRGLTPEAMAVELLRERLVPAQPAIVPQDDWERRLLGAAKDYGVSLPPEALTSEGIYE
jgi:hypothetical protein